MSFDAKRLFNLMPAIYRIRDAEEGGALETLLAVIADQINVIEEDLAQLHDDQFIETCSDWVVPYIGDLIGYRPLHNVAPQVVSQRAEVAHTIGYRRRKGTAAMLEQLARDVTAWNARAVEFFQQLGWTQWTPNHIRPNSFYSPNLRAWETLENVDGPFDTISHTVDVRSIANGGGKHNIRNIGIFLWRLGAYPSIESSAFQVTANQFTFHPLGQSQPLFTKPDTEVEASHIADPINVPHSISRRVLNANLPLYYGEGKSIFIKGVPSADNRIIVCDLTDWINTPPPNMIGVDPVLGRIVFAEAPVSPPVVMFHYGFSADMGGGAYERAATIDARLLPVENVPAPHATIQSALDAAAIGGSVEIANSATYAETLSINAGAGTRCEVRGVNGHRPNLALGGEFLINGSAGSEVTLNGLLIGGATIRITGAPRKVRFRHCTLAPGAQPSLVADMAGVTIEIDHCIVGGLQIHEGSHVLITDSIVDATDEAKPAFAAAGGTDPGASLQVLNSTIVGTVQTRELELASNTIFISDVRSARRQQGCVRFSYLPLDSHVPRRYHCRPADEANEPRARPQFTSIRYGDPGYGQLTLGTALEIRAGADDGAEMGAFHHLYQPQRETNLRVRLEEYLRLGLEAGIFYVT